MPPQQRPSAGRIVIGCVAVFLLPFLGAGIAMLNNGIRQLQRGGGTSAALLLGGGLVFAMSLGAFGLTMTSLRQASRGAELRSQHPNEPWLWRADWSERRIVDGGGAKLAVLWVFAIVWNAVSTPLILLVRREWEKGNTAIAFGLLFPLVGVVLLIVAMYGTLRRMRFGVPVCTIDQLPVPIGGRCSGAIAVRAEVQPETVFLFTLRNIRAIRGDESTNETILSKAQQRVSSGEVMRSAGETRVPFHFDIPPDGEPTDETVPGNRILWRLDVSAELPGVDYAASFELPVFGVATREGESVAAYHAEQRDAAARRSLSADSRIETRPLAEGGIEVVIPPRRDCGTAVFFVVFLTIWSGAIVFMWRVGAPRFLAVIFGGFELLIVILAVDFLFCTSVLRASRAGVEVRRGIGGGGRSRLIVASDIESVDAVNSGQTNNKPLWGVQARLTNGRKRTLANYLRSSDDAATVAARVWQALGRG